MARHVNTPSFFTLQLFLTALLIRPVEIHQIQLKPADFFAANPSIDVPSNKNLASELVENGKCCEGKDLALNGANGVNGSTNGVVH